MKKLLLILISASLLLSLSACGSGSSSSTQTVFAQTAYSNASLTGTYSVTFSSFGSGISSSNVSYYNAIGTIQLNGAGGITGGTLNFYFVSGVSPCIENVSGTYSLQSTALGTASLVLSSSSNGCNATATLPLNVAAAGQGTSILLSGSTQTTEILTGVAIKQ
jgi:hypothetical protein